MTVGPVPGHRRHGSAFGLETRARKRAISLAAAGIVLFGVAQVLNTTEIVSLGIVQVVLWGWIAASLASATLAVIAYRTGERSRWLLLPSVMGVLCVVALVWNLVVQVFGNP
jgi:hypothetical protein